MHVAATSLTTLTLVSHLVTRLLTSPGPDSNTRSPTAVPKPSNVSWNGLLARTIANVYASSSPSKTPRIRWPRSPSPVLNIATHHPGPNIQLIPSQREH